MTFLRINPLVGLLFLIMVLTTLFCISGTPAPPLSFLPEELPAARTANPYGVTISISGNRTPLFEVGIIDGALPHGLKLQYSPEVGYAQLVGTPLEAGEFDFTIQASCLGTSVNGQIGEKEYTLVVQ